MEGLALLRSLVYERNKHDAGWDAADGVSVTYVLGHTCFVDATGNTLGRKRTDARSLREGAGNGYGDGYGDGYSDGDGGGNGGGNGDGNGGGYGRGYIGRNGDAGGVGHGRDPNFVGEDRGNMWKI